MNKKEKLLIVMLVVSVFSLVLYSFYTHKDEPHWFEMKYVKVVK